VATNARRGKQDMEYELLDTAIFDEDRYFDVVVEYAKGAHDDILIAGHRAQPRPGAASLHLLPTLWFRNTWSWGGEVEKPTLTAADGGAARAVPPGAGGVAAARRPLGAAAVLRERDQQRAPLRRPERLGARQGRHQRLRRREAPRTRSTRPARDQGAAHHVLEVGPGESASIRVRLTAGSTPVTRWVRTSIGCWRPAATRPNEFYATVIPSTLEPDAAMVMRQALAGLLWGKQYYEYDVHRWLREHGVNPWDPNAPASSVRNVPWFHMVAGDVISMPDKWEYPWFAAWDLAFHCAPLSLVDVDFAKQQVELLLGTRYLHPNGQIPAYRVELQRRQPAGHGVGGALRLRARGRDPGRRANHEFLARVFPAAADELHLVGESQGPRRPQPLPGWVPRPRQHRHLRSLGAAPWRRHARAGGRHRMDGSLLPVDAADRRELAKHDPAYGDMAVKFAITSSGSRSSPRPAGPNPGLWTRRMASTTT
jgi:hypothetical protein